MSVLDTVPHGARVAILRLRSLGDCVLTTPAIRLLKQARPDLQLSAIVENRFREIFEGNPDLSSILSPRALPLLRLRPFLTINLHGGTRSAVLTASSLARLRVGFGHYRLRSIYNVLVPRAQQILRVNRKVHTAEHVASLMFYLGVPQAPIPRASLFAAATGTLRDYAVIHPFAAAAAKAWPSERFAEVARHLEEGGLEAVVIGARGDDVAPFKGFRCISGVPLSQIKSVIRNGSLFVGNDSGPAHIAAAFGVPSVVLFGPSDPEIWGPWQTQAETLRGDGSMHSIRLDEVTSAISHLRVAR